jgi:hypothetical protein
MYCTEYGRWIGEALPCGGAGRPSSSVRGKAVEEASMVKRASFGGEH